MEVDLQPLRKFVLRNLSKHRCGDLILKQPERINAADFPLFAKIVLDNFDLQQEEE